MRRESTPLTERQLRAVRVLLRHRSLPITEKATSEKAINRTTAWGLEEAGVVACYFAAHDIPMKERVKLLPAAKQLVQLGGWKP